MIDVYKRQLKDSAIQPIAIQRTNGYHDEDIQHAISSATAIRRAVKEKKPISHTTPIDVYKRQTVPSLRFSITRTCSQKKHNMPLTAVLNNLFITGCHQKKQEIRKNQLHWLIRM